MEGKGSAVGGSFPNRSCPPLFFPPIGMNSGLCVGLIYLFPSFAYRIEQRRPFSPAINIHHGLAAHAKGLNCHQAALMLLFREQKGSAQRVNRKEHFFTLHSDRLGFFHFLLMCSVPIQTYASRCRVCEGSVSSLENRGYTKREVRGFSPTLEPLFRCLSSM